MNSDENSSTISKVGDLLEALARFGRPVSLTELSEALPYPKPTLRRLLLQLMDTGMVQQNSDTRHYRLGRRLITLAAAVLDQMDVRREAAPILHELTKEIGESVYLTILDGDSIVYVDVVEGEHSVKIVTKVGTRRPAHSTATGKAMLAFSGEEVRQNLLQHRLQAITTKTVTDPALLTEQLHEIQQIGIAISIDEAEVGVVGVAAPVFDGLGSCVAAIGVAIPTYRYTKETEEHISTRTQQAASRLSSRMGASAQRIPVLSSQGGTR